MADDKRSKGLRRDGRNLWWLLENIPVREPNTGCISLNLICYEAAVAAVGR